MSLRSLQHGKSNRIEIKKGVPSPSEGNNGELRLGITAKGIFLYVKYGNRWYQLGDAAISSAGQFSAQGVASQGAGTLATSIDRGNQSLNMGGNVVMSGNTISDTGSNQGIKFDDSATVRVDVATTKIGTNGYLSLADNEIDISSGNLTVDVAGDVTLDAGGADINFSAAGTAYLSWNATGNLKMMSVSDTGDYFNIQVTTAGKAVLTTVDDSGGNAADIVLQPQGDITMTPGANNYFKVSPTTKTASSTHDATIDASETLNLSSGAGGSDIHYGIRYRQIQTDLTGWDGTYLMHLYGGDAARTFAIQADGKVGIGVTDPASPLEIFNTASQLKISYDASNYADVSVASDGHLGLTTTGTDADITLDSASEIILDSNNGSIKFFDAGDSDDFASITVVGGTGNTTLGTTSAGDDGHIRIFPDGDFVLQPQSGNFISKTPSGTEFSAANSAYAGMILGYTSLLNDAADTSYNVTASFATIHADTKVTFVAPPSGNVEIFASVFAKWTTNRWLQFGLSDNATYNAVDVTHEHFIGEGDETDEMQINHRWVITGLTAASSYTYWVGAKAEQLGRVYLYWGGDATGEYAPFIVKATALPATIYEG